MADQSKNDAQKTNVSEGQPLESVVTSTLPTLCDHSVNTKSDERGKRVSLVSNYLRLYSHREVIVYDYDVVFEHNVESIVVRKAMLYNHRQSFGDSMIFNGMANVKSPVLLPEEETELFSTRHSDNANIRITVRLNANTIALNRTEMMRLYNTQMRRNLRLLNWDFIGRYYFNTQMRHTIPEHRLDVIQGMKTSVNRHHNENILMRYETVTKILRSDTVLQHMNDIMSRDRDLFAVNVRKEFVGQVVITEYNNRTYIINDIAFDKNPLTTFDYRNDGQITLKHYYQKRYNITICDDRQPLLIVPPLLCCARADLQSVIYLIPELCKFCEISESQRKDINVMRAVLESLRTDPNSRVTDLNGFIQSVNNNPQIKQEMSAWNLELSPSLVELSARVLDCENIVMADNIRIEFNQKTGEFKKEIRGKAMFAGITITNWVILVSLSDRHIVWEFANTLNRMCRPMGVLLSRPQVPDVGDDRTASYMNACLSIHPSTQLVVVILSDNTKERYDAIKKYFCCEQPIASQMVLMKSVSKKPMLMNVCTKIGIQMACKLGAQPWAVDIPLQNVMIVGLSVHRDRIESTKFFGGLVCSTNATFTKWLSRASFHSSREQRYNNLSENFQEALKHYRDINKQLPSIIIVYRDGMSKSYIEHVFQYESQHIQTVIENTCKEASQSIKLAFIIANRDLNSKFFLRVDQSFDNPETGTVVDSVVTREGRNEFYLVSQRSLRHTTAPTKYNIMIDNTDWSPQQHQQLAYKLCHLYYNWSGTIQCPAPCFYAHKLAYLTATVLHRLPNESLSDTLFYL